MATRNRDAAHERAMREAAEPATVTEPGPRMRTTDWADWPDTRSSFTSSSGRPTPKWRGVSILPLREKAEEINDIHRGIRALQRAAHDAKTALHQEVEGLLGIRVILGTQDCPESPTSACIYLAADEDCDQCIFCAELHERK